MAIIIEFPKLEKYRKKMNMTYFELAQKIGVPENYIYRWRKNGKVKGVYGKIVQDVIK